MTREFLRAKYLQLAQRLGEVELQLIILNEQKAEAVKAMKELDASVPMIEEFRNAVTKSVLANEAAKATNGKEAKTEETQDAENKVIEAAKALKNA